MGEEFTSRFVDGVKCSPPDYVAGVLQGRVNASISGLVDVEAVLQTSRPLV